MTKTVALFGVMVVGVVGCSSSDGTTNPGTNSGTASVRIAASTTTVSVGASAQLTGVALDSRGKPLPTATFTWASDNQAIATVTNQGLVQGVTDGVTTIRATSGSKSGSVAINVNKDYCTNALTLNVGQVRILSGPNAVSCLTLAATTGPSDFLIVTANAANIPDALGLYNVSLSQVGTFTATPSRALQRLDPRVVLEREAVSYADWKEDHIRADERAAARRVFAGGRRPTLNGDDLLHAAVAAAAVPSLGDTLGYHVPNINTSSLCSNFTDVRAVVKAVGTHAILVQDVNAPPGGFTAADFTAIAKEFDDKIYEADTLWFGSPTDRNGDGHISILFTPEVNKVTPAGSVGFTAGFFWGGDLFKRSEYPTSTPCPATNEQEMFYMLVPDPQGSINSNVRTTVTVRQGTRGVIAHEFEHMINQGVRMFNPAVDSLETPWLNEAMAHFAEEAVGRTEDNFGDSQALRFDDINPGGANGDDYNAFFRQNLARLRSWMQRPDTASPISARARSQLAPRGAGWMLVRYAADQFGNGNPRAFFRKLAFGPDVNITNLEARAGVPFDEILSGFLVSMFADNDNVAGLEPRFTVPSWDLRDVMTSYNKGMFPLAISTLPGVISTQSLSGSGNYFRLTRDQAAPQTKFQMTAASGTPVSFEGARIYVLRLQ